MPRIKQKPKADKARGKNKTASQPALNPRQAAKLLRDKYVQQLDQRPEGEEGPAEYAIDQVEAVEQFAVDELPRPRSPRQREQRIKEKPRPAQDTSGKPASGPEAPQIRDTLQSRATPQGNQPTSAAPQPNQRTVTIKERPALKIKEAGSRPNAPLIKDRSAPNIHRIDPSIKSIPTADRQTPPQARGRAVPHTDAAPASPRRSSAGRTTIHTPEATAAPGKPTQPAPAQRMVDYARRRLYESRQARTSAGASPSITAQDAGATTPPGQQFPKVRSSVKGSSPKVQRDAYHKGASSPKVCSSIEGSTPKVQGNVCPKGVSNPKVRSSVKGSSSKVRGMVYSKGASSPKVARTPFKTAAMPVRALKQPAKQRMTQQAVKRAGKAAKKTAAAAKRVMQAVTKAAASLVSSLVGLMGGGVLLIVLVAVIIIAAVANSPFGLLFAEERSGPGTVSVAEAVGTVNVAYNAKLEELQAGDYDSIDVTGAAADWPDVLAVFAARYAGAEDGVDVATLDADRVSKLTATFWDMTALTSTVETIDHPDSDPDDDTDDSWTERILHLTITAKTAEDMKTAYAFSAYQISALDELLADRAALSSLAGSLAITNTDAVAVLNALPDDLSTERRTVVETALTLYGKVNYFWGGKSRVIGWDTRWGQTMKVTAAGSSTTGTYRPYGLDCSGFADWVFYNASGGSYIIGHGGGAHNQHNYCTAIAWADAKPGDLVFYPEDEHVGIVCGRDDSGDLLIIHCSSGHNNVVITGVSGFTSIGRPIYYGE